MILRNPTDSKIEVVIFGVECSVEPKGTTEVRDDIGKYWVERLHSFLIIEGSEAKKPTKKEEVIEEEIEEEKPKAKKK